MSVPHSSVPHSPSIDNATFSTFGKTQTEYREQKPVEPAAAPTHNGDSQTPSRKPLLVTTV